MSSSAGKNGGFRCSSKTRKTGLTAVVYHIAAEKHVLISEEGLTPGGRNLGRVGAEGEVELKGLSGKHGAFEVARD